MIEFAVKVKTETSFFSYNAIATDSCSVIDSAIDQFGVCAVSVKPIKDIS